MSTYIVDHKCKVWFLCTIILTHILVSVPIKLSWLSLLIRVVLLFIDKYSLALLWQLGMGFILTKVVEILAHLVLLSYHVVDVRVLTPLLLLFTVVVVHIMRVMVMIESRLFNDMSW